MVKRLGELACCGSSFEVLWNCTSGTQRARRSGFCGPTWEIKSNPPMPESALAPPLVFHFGEHAQRADTDTRSHRAEHSQWAEVWEKTFRITQPEIISAMPIAAAESIGCLKMIHAMSTINAEPSPDHMA